ncbi:hypothetical protein [Flagellimonas meridianipacifica]|uniref:DUF4105 domain-containing protein n=1 Tax=Flagellimonas meridianipacifica TaxID=1080225 RepID=A0A2T0MBP3_9FLAO|nr:hypothetical protein [Allomuricauda pacifica]PRX54918.1 hypothetical protein CLV81_3323 [Allomuricauda pacifica]
MGEIFKKRLLLAILMCSLFPLNAQKKTFLEGYIIEKSGDTIQGLIKDRSQEPFVSLYNKVRFKKIDHSRTRKYGPSDILGYGYHGQNFASVPFREESTFFKFRYYSDIATPKTFLRVIQRSKKLVYYEQLVEDDDSSYLDAVPFFHRPNSNEMVRVTQGIFGLRRKQLKAYFSDCPSLLEEITNPETSIKTVPELYEFCIAHCFK